MLNDFYVIFSVHKYMLIKNDTMKAKWQASKAVHYCANRLVIWGFFLVKGKPIGLDTAGIHYALSPECRFIKNVMWYGS